MKSVLREARHVKGSDLLADAITAGEEALRQMVVRRLNELLVLAVTYLLGRESYVRRKQVAAGVEMTGQCARCKSQQVVRLRRNGYRLRSLLTPVGWIDFLLPRVRCRCGGSVEMDFSGLVRPYQRISDDVDEQIRHWYHLGLSLRQLEQELARSYLGPLGRRTLLSRLHQLVESAGRSRPSAVPAVVQLDAIWITQLVPTGEFFHDRKGRRRQRKARVKRPVLIALGVWPEDEYTAILDSLLGDSEDAEQWTAFLERLEENGVRGENGLELLIHDGGAGLCAALQTVHFDAHQQRCLFHKLRNITRAIRLPDGLSRPERSRQRKAILKEFRAIWQAKGYTTLLRRYLRVVRQFRSAQPEAVATLRRDFRHTIGFFQILRKHPDWQVRFLRTTSRLERFNRSLRRRARTANAFHSDAGVLAMISYEVAQFNA